MSVMSERRRAPLNTVTSRPGPMLAALMMAASLGVACEKPAPPAAPPTEVVVTDVVQKDVPVYLELVGQTKGFQDVDIRARVEGFLETVNFNEGSVVRKGALLYEIDRKPLEAALAAAKADLAASQARLEKAAQRRHTVYAARGETGGQQAGTGQCARGAGCRHRGSRVREGGGGEGDARLELHARHVADRRINGPDASEAGQSRRPRRKHAAHHGLAA